MKKCDKKETDQDLFKVEHVFVGPDKLKHAQVHEAVMAALAALGCETGGCTKLVKVGVACGVVDNQASKPQQLQGTCQNLSDGDVESIGSALISYQGY